MSTRIEARVRGRAVRRDSRLISSAWRNTAFRLTSYPHSRPFASALGVNATGTGMTLDVCALVRRDHDDLDRALVAMVDPLTPPTELSNLLEVFRLALAVHAAAEAKVIDVLLACASAPRTLGILAMQTRVEHGAQRAAAESLSFVRPASIAWYGQALELRVLVLDHASRGLQTRCALEDYVPAELRRSLAGEYATQRMRVLASTSPLLTAKRLETVSIH